MKVFVRILNWIILVFGINMPMLLASAPLGLKIGLGAVLLIYFIVFNVFPSFRKYPSLRLKILGDGAELILAFWVTCAASAPFVGICIGELIGGGADYVRYIVYGVVLVLCEAAVFWNGIIRV